MVTYDFSRRKAPWFQRGLWAVFALVIAALVVTGCPLGTEDEASVLPLPNGWYKGSALPPYDDGYGIEDDALTYYSDGSKTVNFKGMVQSYKNKVVIIKVTATSDYGPAVNKYYGVYMGDVTGFSFTGSSAYKEGGKNSGVDTLEEAVSEYTDDNGYFAYKAGYGRYAGPATVTGTNSGLKATWPAVPGAAGYELYYTSTATPPTSPPTSETAGNATGVTITGTTAAITGLTNGTAYSVWVRAKDASRTGPWVYQGNGTPDALALAIAGYFKGDAFPWDDGVAFSASRFYQYDDGGLGISYSGDIVKHIPIGGDGKAGRIIIKITEPGSWEKTTGNYYAIAYKDYGYSPATQTTNIQTSSAYKEGGQNNGVSTIDAAVAEYTSEAGYFAFYGDYRKLRDEIPQKDAGLTLTGLEGAWSGTDYDDDDDDDYFIRIANPVLTWSSDLGNNTAMCQFAGTIVETTASSAASGYIYIKVDFVNTTATGGHEELKVGNYYGIHWKDKTGGGIKLCAADGSDEDGTETLSAAKTEFTVAKDYFDDDDYVVITPNP
ncbi:MAG: hypothetical protein LBE17_03940 [Treponema sp.]|jgi:hypothetical protein|nr:hypothetical protein [Treponema sp.]